MCDTLCVVKGSIMLQIFLSHESLNSLQHFKIKYFSKQLKLQILPRIIFICFFFIMEYYY